MRDLTNFLNFGLLCLVLSYVVPDDVSNGWRLLAVMALLGALVLHLLGFISWVLARKLEAMKSETSFFAEVWRYIREPSQ